MTDDAKEIWGYVGAILVVIALGLPLNSCFPDLAHARVTEEDLGFHGTPMPGMATTCIGNAWDATCITTLLPPDTTACDEGDVMVAVTEFGIQHYECATP